MAAGSLTKFYIALAVVGVAGGAWILRASAQKGPPLTLATVAPLATGARGVTMGSDSAKVEIMEFSDFECPYCGRFAVVQLPDARQRLVATGRARWRFVHFPLDQHTRSPYAHLAAACANEQGRFWEMEDLLYQNQDDWATSGSSERLIDGYAERAVADQARYRSCVAERRAWGQVLADKKLGDSLGINGTPTFFVNGRQLADPPAVTVDRLVHIVDSITSAAPASAGRGAARAPR